MTLADSDAHRLDHLDAVARLGAALLGDCPERPLPEPAVAALRRRLTGGARAEAAAIAARWGSDVARDLIGVCALLLGALPDDDPHARMTWVWFTCWRLRRAGVDPYDFSPAVPRLARRLFPPVVET
jgi:hypothetical protein